MQDTNKQFEPQQNEEIEINLKEYLDVIIKRKKLIVVITLLLTAIITVYVFLQPNIYKSTAVIIPQSSSSGGLSSMLSSVAGSLGGLLPSLGGGGEELGTFNNVLNSNDLPGKVVDKLDLLTVFNERDFNVLVFITSFLPSKEKSYLDKAKERDELIKSMKEDIVVVKKDDKANSITISVFDEDPILAQKIAQQYLIELDTFLNENNMTVAKKNRLFLEDQLSDNKTKLTSAENALKYFQERNNIISPDKQAELSVTATADIQAQIAIEEMNLNTMKITGYKKSSSVDIGGVSGGGGKLEQATDADIQSSKVNIQQLKKQMNNLTFGESFSPLMKGKTSGVTVPLNNAPNLTLEYMRLKREAMVQEKIFEFLTEQYESAKLLESNESISFIVVDKPKVATKKDKPKRAIMVILGIMAGLFLGALAVFTLEWYLKQNPNPKFLEPNEKDNKIKKYVKGLLQ